MNILLVDDHSLFREGMRHVLQQLEPDITVFEANQAQSALNAFDDHPNIDLVLLDLNLPGVNGFEILKQIKAKSHDVAVIMLSASEDINDARQALDNGAVGYIPKSATSQVMLSAIRLVLSGGVYVPPLILSQLQQRQAVPNLRPGSQHTAGHDSVHNLPSSTALGSLTTRQMDVLILLAEGKSNKEIGRKLGMAEGTVKIHVTAIFKSLGVVNRTQAVLAAEKMGLVSNNNAVS